MFSALDYSIEAEKRRKQLLKPKQPGQMGAQVGQVGAQPATSPNPYGETPPPPLAIPKPGAVPLAKPKYRESDPSRPGSSLVRTELTPMPAHLAAYAAPVVSKEPGAWNAVPKQAVPTFERNPTAFNNPAALVDGTAGGMVPPRTAAPIQMPGQTGPLKANLPEAPYTTPLGTVAPYGVAAVRGVQGAWSDAKNVAGFVNQAGGTIIGDAARRAAVGYAAGGVGGAFQSLRPPPARVPPQTPLAMPQPGQPAPPPLAIPRPQPGASYGSQNPAGAGQSTTIPATGGQDADRQRMQNQLLALKDQRMAFQRQEFALPAGDPGREQYRRAQVMVANQINQLEQGLRYNPDAAAPAQRTIVDVGNARTALRQKGDAMLEAEKRDLMLKVAQKSIPPEAMARAQARITEINEQRAQLDERLPDLHGQDLDRTTAGVNAAAQSQFQRSQSEGASRYANARDDSAQAFKARADKFEYDSAMRRAELARVNADTRASEQSGTDSGAAAIKAEADRVEAQTRLEKSKTDAGMAKTLGTVQADENRETEFASSQVGRSADRIAETLSKLGGAGSYIGSDRGGDVTAIAREWSELRRSIEALPPEQQAQAKIEVARKLNGAGADQSSGSFLGWIGSTLDKAIDWTGRKDTPVGQRRHNNQRLRAIAEEMQAYFPT